VGNTAKTDATATVRPNFAGLKLPGGAADAGVDLESGAKVPLTGGASVTPARCLLN